MRRAALKLKERKPTLPELLLSALGVDWFNAQL
jgi:hypothetical protein